MADSDEGPESVGREITGQMIGLAFTIAAAVVVVMVQRYASDPDFERTWRMRAAKRSERFCASLAARLWSVAEKARLRYEADCQ